MQALLGCPAFDGTDVRFCSVSGMLRGEGCNAGAKDLRLRERELRNTWGKLCKNGGIQFLAGASTIKNEQENSETYYWNVIVVLRRSYEDLRRFHVNGAYYIHKKVLIL